MKHLIYLALISALVSGCADTPSKQASIEDRALVSTADKPADVTTTSTAPNTAASTSGAPISDVSSKPLATDAGKSKDVSGVETRGVVQQNPEAKPLADTTQAAGGTNAAGTTGGQADHADTLKFVAQPVLDPKNPQSPLAQQRRLLFDYDSAAIRDEYRSMLEMHAQYLKKEKSAKVILQGNTDERGSREYNIALGQRRAESVYKALNLLGVPENQMEAVSFGEEKPIAEGHDETAWAQNRRTEIMYQGE
jgi:peptidoglycan-associated lipoprotein